MGYSMRKHVHEGHKIPLTIKLVPFPKKKKTAGKPPSNYNTLANPNPATAATAKKLGDSTPAAFFGLSVVAAPPPLLVPDPEPEPVPVPVPEVLLPDGRVASGAS